MAIDAVRNQNEIYARGQENRRDIFIQRLRSPLGDKSETIQFASRRQALPLQCMFGGFLMTSIPKMPLRKEDDGAGLSGEEWSGASAGSLLRLLKMFEKTLNAIDAMKLRRQCKDYKKIFNAKFSAVKLVAFICVFVLIFHS